MTPDRLDLPALSGKCRTSDGHPIRRIRHSNFIERTFGETRRRAKVIGGFPSETSCISIVWAVLDRASCGWRGWRGLTMTPAGLRLLQDLRRSLLEPPRQLRPRPAPTRRTSDRPEPARRVISCRYRCGHAAQ